jgi:recombination protein RecA
MSASAAHAALLQSLPKALLSARQLSLGALPQQAPAQWCLAELSGRLTELSSQGASANLTLAFYLVLDAQRQGETVVWISARASPFYPPDVAAAGVDLAALVVVHTQTIPGSVRAADHLLRSGGFGLVVMDLGLEPRVSVAAQSRLLGLVQKHGSALLCLTEKGRHTPSIGSLVSLRGETERKRLSSDRFQCNVQIIKDKRRAPGWTAAETFCGPTGLR